MSWDLSSEEVICDKLESQQRTIEMFSKKIKSLEAELNQQKFNNTNNLSIDQKVYDQILFHEKTIIELRTKITELEATKKLIEEISQDSVDASYHETVVDELEKLLTFYLDFAEEITKKMISVYKFEPGQIDVMLTCLEKVKKDRECLK